MRRPEIGKSYCLNCYNSRGAERKFVATLCLGTVLGFAITDFLLFAVPSFYEDLDTNNIAVFRKTHIIRNSDPIINYNYDKFKKTRTFDNNEISGGVSKDDYESGGKMVATNDVSENVKVLCWVMTSPKNHESRAKHVKATWGRHCNILLFMSSEYDAELPTVALPVIENRNYLWNKTKEAFKHVYGNYFNKADWFMKADDDTYVIVQNLRYMLRNYNTSKPMYFGCKFKPFVQQGYMSGGAGYVLSKEALRTFVEIGLADPQKCGQYPRGTEDVELGKCMENVNVTAMDTRDSSGGERFVPFRPDEHIFPGHSKHDFWYWKYMYHSRSEGIESLSDHPISFHYIDREFLYVFEYFIYHLRPYGTDRMSNFTKWLIKKVSKTKTSKKI